jgi:hypothetical protein
MAPDTETTETAAPEFAGEAERENHVAGLLREKASYAQKAAGLKAKNDADGASYYDGRAGQVDDELKRLGADAKTASARAERR